MKRSYFVAVLAVAAVIGIMALAVPEAQTLAYNVLHPAALMPFMLAHAALAVPVSSKKMRSLQGQKLEHVKAMRALQAAADGRDFSAEEQSAYDGLKAKLEAVNKSIDREADLVAEEASLGVATLPDGGIMIENNAEKDGKRGFRTSGDFFRAVRLASVGGNQPDPRLLIGAAAPTTFGNEGAGADGGFAIPPDYASEIFAHSLGEDSLLPLTDGANVSGNSMVFPKDETTPWGTDGIRAYWQSEAAAATQTKPKLSTTTLRLSKLMALVPLTDELLDDTNALSSYLPKKVGDSIRWKTNEAILFGTGAGQPLGAFNGNAVVTVAKEAGQATLTLQAMNIGKMIARLPAGSYGRAIWLINNDVIPALYTLTLGNYPIYMPISSGLQSTPYGTLSGRPIMVSQHAKSFTNQGDVLLLDPQYVRSIQKAAGMVTATSMHIYFDADATAFRTTFRVDAQPKIVNPIAPFNGSNNLSPFVQLGAR
jgi:HK97 family phage major capsid protein